MVLLKTPSSGNPSGSNDEEWADKVACLYRFYTLERSRLIKDGVTGWGLFGLADGIPVFVGSYDDFADAESEGDMQFEPGNFIVQCIQGCDEPDYSAITLVQGWPSGSV